MSFKSLLTSAKQDFAEWIDIALLPKGQLNPHSEQGLLPLFSGAYTLAKLSKHKIHFMPLHGSRNHATRSCRHPHLVWRRNFLKIHILLDSFLIILYQWTGVEGNGCYQRFVKLASTFHWKGNHRIIDFVSSICLRKKIHDCNGENHKVPFADWSKLF